MKPFILSLVLTAAITFPAIAQNKAPNAVENFKDAAELLKNDSSDFVSGDMATKRAAVAKNADALRALRRGFAFEYSRFTSFDELDSEYRAKMRALARLLVAEGEIHLADNKNREAVDSFLDAIRLGQELPRGEPILGAMVGNAVESIGRRPLWENISKFDATSARHAALRLQFLNTRRHPATDTLRSEQSFSEKFLAQTVRKIAPADGEKLMAQYQAEMQKQIELAARPYTFGKEETSWEALEKVEDFEAPDMQIPLSRALANDIRFSSAKSQALNSLWPFRLRCTPGSWTKVPILKLWPNSRRVISNKSRAIRLAMARRCVTKRKTTITFSTLSAPTGRTIWAAPSAMQKTKTWRQTATAILLRASMCADASTYQNNKTATSIEAAVLLL
jgi:hypothetical protein